MAKQPGDAARDGRVDRMVREGWQEQSARTVIDVCEAAGLLVLDPSSEALGARIADLFWLRLQDYMPGMDRDDWEQFVHWNIRPDLPAVLRALAGNEPGGKA